MYSRPNVLSHNWVPIKKRIVTTPITLPTKQKVKCVRRQFPLVPACAITIHKSQGGTFKEIVYKYSKNQLQQLVYVALSRVTDISGLYIITDKNKPFVFQHGKSENNSTALENIRKEFSRLETHNLHTIVNDALKFIDIGNDKSINICNFNTQSLAAHVMDINSDPVLPLMDYLLLTETWDRMTLNPIEILNFECICRINNSSDKQQAAGGVAIYKRVTAKTFCEPLNIYSGVESDVCGVKIRVEGTNLEFALVCIYIHPGCSEICVFQNLKKIQESTNLPIIICGDFNLDLARHSDFFESLKHKLMLDCINNPLEATTLGGTCLDLTLLKPSFLCTDIMRYISYFSYHRPMITKIFY